MQIVKFFTGALLLCAASFGHAEQATIHITEVPSPTGEWKARTATVEVPAALAETGPRAPEVRVSPDTVTIVRTAPPGSRYTWNMVMLIYKSIDCETTRNGVSSRFTYTMTAAEINDARTAMISAVNAIFAGSNQQAHVTLTIVEVGRTLTALAKAGDVYYWPDADITAPELNLYCSGGAADSAMIYWPSRNHATGARLYNDYWGLSYGEIQSYSKNVGYSTVANILSPNDSRYIPGEVFLHEWLHPTGGYYEDNHNAIIPNLDASGNYRPCPGCTNYGYISGDGYMEYYQDYMTASVWNPVANRYEGIQTAHWQAGTPTNTVVETSVNDWAIY